jgi:hypothetical protein
VVVCAQYQPTLPVRT